MPFCSGVVLGDWLSYSYLFYILKLVFDDLTISFISNALYNKVKIKIKKKIKPMRVLLLLGLVVASTNALGGLLGGLQEVSLSIYNVT